MTLQCLSVTSTAVLLWLAATIISVALILILGAVRIRVKKAAPNAKESAFQPRPTEVLIPVKGRSTGQETALASLLVQSHPNYTVTFIVEDESDEANVVVDSMCARHKHARKIVAGPADLCAQKNHNLIAAIRRLRPETEVVILCDSTNCADYEWLSRFTSKLDPPRVNVVTTFRVFNPPHQSVWGVCQAIYGAALFIAQAAKPKPWGGATAISRQVLDSLDVARAWSRTIVDDLVLGNLLDEAGHKVTVAPDCRLTTPLVGQTFSGFLNYLDRQLVFPKFTNPGIWLASLVLLTNLSTAIVVSAILVGLSIAGLVEAFRGCAGLLFLVGVESAAILLLSTNPFGIPWWKWFTFLPVLVFLSTYLLIRSVFRNYLIWHGKRYQAGAGGQVTAVTPEPGASQLEKSGDPACPVITPKAV